MPNGVGFEVTHPKMVQRKSASAELRRSKLKFVGVGLVLTHPRTCGAIPSMEPIKWLSPGATEGLSVSFEVAHLISVHPRCALCGHPEVLALMI